MSRHDAVRPTPYSCERHSRHRGRFRLGRQSPATLPSLCFSVHSPSARWRGVAAPAGRASAELVYARPPAARVGAERPDRGRHGRPGAARRRGSASASRADRATSRPTKCPIRSPRGRRRGGRAAASRLTLAQMAGAESRPYLRADRGRGARHQVDPRLVHARDRRSSRLPGARALAQGRDGADAADAGDRAASCRSAIPYDPATNIDAGVRT